MAKDITPGSDLNISRRAVLSRFATGAALIGSGGLAACITVPDTGGISKEAAQYQGHANDGQRCGSCAHYNFPVGCDLVEGLVSLHGWCTLYTPASNVEAIGQ
jgi:hypothetical protein